MDVLDVIGFIFVEEWEVERRGCRWSLGVEVGSWRSFGFLEGCEVFVVCGMFGLRMVGGG